MLKHRVIPCLLLQDGGLVKTRKFRAPRYVGDPINAIRIFNDKEVDELVLLDITASAEGRGPRLELIRDIASECFMPLGYGGGISTLQHVHDLLYSGVEKVVVNTACIRDLEFVRTAAKEVGSQSVVASIDFKRKFLGSYEVFAHRGQRSTGFEPVEFARRMEEAGVGEILLNSIDRDGCGKGYDIELTRRVADAVTIPVIAAGGAGTLEHFREAIVAGHASAVSAGSMFVFHGPHRAVLINYPRPDELTRLVP